MVIKKNIRVGKYTRTPSGRRLKNKFIVFDNRTLKPLSGLRGQSRSTAFRIARRLRKR